MEGRARVWGRTELNGAQFFLAPVGLRLPGGTVGMWCDVLWLWPRVQHGDDAWVPSGCRTRSTCSVLLTGRSLSPAVSVVYLGGSTACVSSSPR